MFGSLAGKAMTAPDKIWASVDLGMASTGRWVTQGTENPFNRTQYTRSDTIPAMIAEAVAKEREACATVVNSAMTELVPSVIALAVASEREACAATVESLWAYRTCTEVVDAIRARGKP
ncbi:MAG: hypothetical protein U5N55_04785 [Cypionkella sp.]|nr:hypothetical protein [Cypionkella sp.]